MKKRITGVVVSDSMDKTRVIEVTRNVRHTLYKKRYKVSKRFYAHDQENKSKIGDQVVIEESRPLSRLKRWTIVSVTQTPTTVPNPVLGEEQSRPPEPGKLSVATKKPTKRQPQRSKT